MAAPVLIARPATPRDARTGFALTTAAAEELTARFGEGHWSATTGIAGVRTKARRGTVYLVEREAQPVAAFILTDKKPGFYRGGWFADPQAKAGYLRDLAVVPRLQRHGIGRYALGQAETLARSRGLSAVRFDAYQGDAGASPFYLKCGSRLAHKGTMRGVPLDYFEKVLTRGT